MKRPSKMALAVVGAVVLAAGVLAALAARPERAAWWTDGNAVRVAEQAAVVREVLWLPAERLTGEGLGSTDEYEPRFSADGTVVVFVRNRPGQNADLYTSRWAPTGWSQPTPIEAINTPEDELGPELSRDGRALYFYSNRPGGLGGYDLWMSRLHEGSWQPPTNVGPAVNSRWNEYGPALSPTGGVIYFSSNRPRPGEPMTHDEGWGATIREHRTRHDYDLYVAELDGSESSEARPLHELNTASDEGAPAMSPSGDFLYFASDRSGGLGGFDLLRVRVKREGRFGSIENLGNTINSVDNDLDPALSSDGFRLSFSSDRVVKAEAKEGEPAARPTEAGRYSLWTSTSREVYRELEVGESRLLGLWPRIWPLLLLALALAPLLLLYRLLRNQAWRQRFARLSLLAQCVLISLFIHAGIASALTVWRVGAGIIEGMHSGGGTRVVLTSGAASGDLAGQIRGTSTGELRSAPEIEQFAMPTVTSTGEVAATHTELPELLVDSTTLATVPASPPTDRVDGYTVLPALPDSVTDLAAAVPTTGGPQEVKAETPVQSQLSQWTPEGAPAIGGAMTSAVTTTLPDPVDRQQGTMSSPRVAHPERSGVANSAGDLMAAQLLPPSRTEGTIPSTSKRQVRVEEAGSRGLPSLESAPMSASAIAHNRSPSLVDVPLNSLPASAFGEHDRLNVPSSIGGPSSDVGSNRGVDSAWASTTSDVPRPSDALTPLGRIPAVAAKGSKQSGEPESRGAKGAEAAFTPPPVATGTSSMANAPVFVAPGPRPIEGGTRGGAVANVIPMPTIAGDRETESSGSRAALPGLRDAQPAPGGKGEIPVGIPVPVETFAQRAPESRGELVERMGGSQETERAVGLALDWFIRHQSADGHWSAEHYDDGCGHCKGAAEFRADAAMTGMVLLCYLGAGHTHMQDGPYREAVRKGLTWLVDRQAPDGDLRRGETMYGQTAAAVALCEAFAMTRDPSLAEPARKAVEFVLARAARQGSSSGRDTSVLGWLVFTVESARRAGFAVPQTTFDSAKQWLEYVGEAGAPGRYAYAKGGPVSAAMTAEAMFVQQLLGRNRDEAMMQQSARLVLGTLPKWQEGAPTYYWYYATLALFQHQGEAWKQWNDALVAELLAHQQQKGEAAGSWAATDQWSRMGGRVYQTAVCTLSLEVYYRYKAK